MDSYCYTMAKTKQTAHKNLTLGLSSRQVETSTSSSSEEEEEAPRARKEARPKTKKRAADSSVPGQEAPPPAAKKPKQAARRNKDETGTLSTSKQKVTMAPKKKTAKGAKKGSATASADKVPKERKGHYVCPVYTGDEEPLQDIPLLRERRRKVMIEYSTNEEVSESILDEAVRQGGYMTIDMRHIKRIKKSIELTPPMTPRAATYPEMFITWYKDHGMMRGMKSATRIQSYQLPDTLCRGGGV